MRISIFGIEQQQFPGLKVKAQVCLSIIAQIYEYVNMLIHLMGEFINILYREFCVF